MFESKQKQNFMARHGFSYKHFLLIGGVVVLVAAMLFAKQPTLFAWAASITKHNTTLPTYYSYASTSAPTVLGASTDANASTQVINDDGTIGNASSLGEVLGASTEEVSAASAPIVVKTVVATPTNVAAYIADVTKLEAESVEPGAFEEALTSTDITAVREQTAKVQSLETALRAMVVPDIAAAYHKVKITQVHAGVLLLQSMHDPNADPEMQSEQISLFLGSDKSQFEALDKLLSYAREGK